MKKYLLAISVILIPFYLYPQSVFKTMLRLPDTGQTIGYTTTFGEDADYTINAPYFTLNGDGTVTDTITGLMWQQTDGGEMTYEAAINYCDTLSLGGFSDWRLPDPSEAFSILNHQKVNPALDTLIFTRTQAEYWWTSERQANDTTRVWETNSGGGIGSHPKSETISAGGTKRFHIRAVRDVVVPPVILARFTDNGDGMIMDNITGLTWQQIFFNDTLTWEQSLTYADTLSLNGYNDWRLPNIKELQSISDVSQINPSIDVIYFNNAGNKVFWSSTTLPNITNKSWYLNTQNGITTYDFKTFRHFVICVRGNQTLPASIYSSYGEEDRVSVYPNPSNGRVTFNLNSETKDDCKIRVYNSLNELILEKYLVDTTNGESTFIFDGSNLPEGVYFYSVLFTTENKWNPITGNFILIK